MEWIKWLYYNVFSTPLCICLIALRLSPNKITILNHIISLTLGVWFFSRGTQWGYLYGVALMLINVILDFADGDVAKRTGKVSQLGVWLDSVFDVVIQAIIMGAIAVGCYKQGLSVYWIIAYYIANIGSNLVSFHYNNTFGFDSHAGSKLFRSYMESKPNLANMFFKNVIDPTSSGIGLATFTVRYWIVLGAVVNVMPYCFMIITCIQNCRWVLMYVIYALHLQEYMKLWVNQALSILDKERKEYYAIRYSKKV